MPTAFVPVITAAGVAAALAADGDGLQLQITHIALGASAYNPTGSETALVDRRETAAVASGASDGVNQITMSAVIRSAGYVGAAYNIGEVGFFAGNPAAGGVLFAVASAAGSNFGGRTSGSIVEFVATFTLSLSGVPSGSVTVAVDPTASVAHHLIEVHQNATNPHPQYEPVGAVPVGAVMPFYSAVGPRGWLQLNGALVSRSVYSELYAHALAQNLIATEVRWAVDSWTLFGEGDGSTTFRLPDARGEFIRGWDQGRGVDAGRVLGSSQADQIEAHKHVTQWGEANGGTLFGRTATAGRYGTNSNDSDNFWFHTNDGSNYDGVVNPGGVIGAETRPRNIALMLCIKAGPATLPAGPTAPPVPVAPPSAPAPAPAPAPGTPAAIPVANFTASPTSVESSYGVSFTDLSTNAPTSWLWDFGDGATSTAQHPTHVYGSYGVARTVTLTATNAAGSDTETKVGYINVTAPAGA